LDFMNAALSFTRRWPGNEKFDWHVVAPLKYRAFENSGTDKMISPLKGYTRKHCNSVISLFLSGFQILISWGSSNVALAVMHNFVTVDFVEEIEPIDHRNRVIHVASQVFSQISSL